MEQSVHQVKNAYNNMDNIQVQHEKLNGEKETHKQRVTWNEASILKETQKPLNDETLIF